jgi:hypothetical protein
MHLSTRIWSQPTLQSAGHARRFEKLPKFQWLVINGHSPSAARARHDLLAGGKNCRAAATMRWRAGVPIL